MASKRVEAEAISSLKALTLKFHSILSENSPGQASPKVSLIQGKGKTSLFDGMNSICVHRGKERITQSA